VRANIAIYSNSELRYCVFVLSLALHDIFHTPVAQCSLFVLKVPVNQLTLLQYYRLSDNWQWTAI